jgi:hypothetical protein
MKTSRWIVVALALLALMPLRGDVQAQQNRFDLWTCSVDDVGATLTTCKQAPEPGLSLYLTDVVINSTTSLGGTYLLRYGTDANCGTGTTSLLPSAAVVPRIAYTGTGSISDSLSLQTPLRVPSGKALCIICSVTNTCTAQLIGYVAP